MPDTTSLRVAVDLRERVAQKNRIAFNNRLSAIEQGRDEASETTKRFLEQWGERMETIESELDASIRDLASDFPIINEMEKVSGVGKLTAAKVVCMIDISRSDNISKLWRYSGFAVIDGKAERPTKGQKLAYNMRLKTAFYVLGLGLMRARGPYKAYYDEARAYYEANRPDWTDGHRHAAALRKMIKLFIAHLWLRWRQMEQLDTEEPYIIAQENNHRHIIPLEKFGWEPYGETA